MHRSSWSRARQLWPVLLAVAVPTACCCPPAPRAAASLTSASGGVVAVEAPGAVLEEAGDSVTQTEFRNVDFHIAPGIVLGVRTLRGEMVSKTKGRPIVFDDKASFTIRLTHAEVALDTESLAHLMNEHVFAYKGAPLRGMSFATSGGELVQRGVLHKVVNIPFEIRASVSLTPVGHIRIHPTSMKICSIDGKGLMRALDIQLADLLDLSKAKGIRVEGNDLVLDPDQLLPPPAIEGRLTAVRVEPGRMVQVFGDDAAAARLPSITPTDTAAPNYMFFRRGTLRFGKLFMVAADMQIVDLDPGDPFDFSIDQYNRQLVAGYSRNQPDLGLEVFMPDLSDVGRRGSSDSAKP